MLWRRALAIAAFAGAILVSGAALAEKRVALVVGVDNYDNVPKLEKAEGDARAMGEALGKLGFDVKVSIDPDRRTLVEVLADLRRRAADADVVFLHFSGHGVNLDGENYILPRDVSKPGIDKSLLEDESLSQTELLRRLAPEKGQRRALIMVFDACRDNPYSDATRSVGGERGLARVDPPKGVFIMYSAGAGETALDRLGPDDAAPTSVYTRTLIGELAKPGHNLVDIANDTKAAVADLAQSASHEQDPAYYDELDGRKIILLPGAAPPVPAAGQPAAALPPVAAVPAARDPCAGAAEHFDATQRIDQVSAYEEHLKLFGSCNFAGLAQARIDAIKKSTADFALCEEATPQWNPALFAARAGNLEPLRQFKQRYGTCFAFRGMVDAQLAKFANAQADAAANPDQRTAMLAPGAAAAAAPVERTMCEQMIEAPGKPATGWTFPGISNAAMAVAACRSAVQEHPDVGRLALFLGRAEAANGDFAAAMDAYRKAADLGDGDAMVAIAYLYGNGQGVAQDKAQSFAWLQKAADRGNAQGQVLLGRVYETGSGVRRDYAQAALLYRKAADQGNMDALNNLAVMSSNGWGMPRNAAQAILLLRRAADSGNAGAQDNLGVMYVGGNGVPRDMGQALALFRKAADQGSVTAFDHLGLMYLKGVGVPKDPVQALEWFRKAANQGDSDAQDNLGTAYENGLGVGQDYAEAATWYQKAADQGNETARAHFRKLLRKMK